MPEGGLDLALVSLEPWDDVWRRNQHLSTALLESGAARTIAFVEPPTRLLRRTAVRQARPGVTAITPSLRLPKRAWGSAELGRRLRTSILRSADVLWVNDPTLGVHCLSHGQSVVYDVTDDWRSYDFPDRIIRRIVRAEDLLARRARTVVCSHALRDRWRARYGVDATVVHNGVDGRVWESASPAEMAGTGPHVGYVGTLQPQRLDIDLVEATADLAAVGTLHLIGPDALGDVARARLSAHPKIRLHGPVASAQVPAYTKALDVLLSPHVVDEFTLSLDAIKSYEYLASGRPVVATPTSGFHLLAGRPGVHVADTGGFLPAVEAAVREAPPRPVIRENDWRTRAQQFAEELAAADGQSVPAPASSQGDDGSPDANR